jgi:hypothetical protein
MASPNLKIRTRFWLVLGGTVANDYDELFDPYELALLWSRSAVGIFVATDEHMHFRADRSDRRRRLFGQRRGADADHRWRHRVLVPHR